jgi:hypothetical protein
MGSYSAKLMRSGEPSQDDPIADMNVTGKSRIIGEDGVAADVAIVRYMHIGHDPVVIADRRLTIALHRATTDRAKFANCIAIPNGQRGWLTGVFLILRIVADRCELVNVIVATNNSRTIDNNVTVDSRTRSDDHVVTN